MRVMLIPGLLCTSAVWGKLNTLNTRYECYEPRIDFADTISGISRYLRKVTRSVKGDLAIIGFSMGGYIAIDMAIHQIPQLRKLVLINTTALPVDPASIDKRKESIVWAENGSFEKIVRIAHDMCFHKPTLGLKRVMQSMARQVGAANYILQQRAIIGRQSYLKHLCKITSETLIITSLEDKIISYKDSLLLLEKIPRAHLVMMKNCGHVSVLEKTDEVANYAMNFLES